MSRVAAKAADQPVSGDYLLEKLDEIWNAYPDDKVGKGSAFEELIAAYLRTAPEFADRFDQVFLWHDWPERTGHDHGIDIVARDVATGGWCAVQCKFYDPQAHVAKADIDSFLAASAKSKYTGRIIVSTAKSWGHTVEKQLDGLTVPVTRIGLSDLIESKVDWSEVNWHAPQTILPTTGKKVLRNHQIEALTKVRDGLTVRDRGQLIMACGTGKTFTALKIAEELATERKAHSTTVLVLVPSIQLLNQTLREWKQESEIPFRAFAVCSDTKVGNGTEDLAVHDLIYPATTDAKVLAREVRARSEHDQFTVVFSTYQSVDQVAAAQRSGMPRFDLVICDEAHRTTGVTLAGDDESNFVRVHDDGFLGADKRLYMTATPRLFDPNVRERAKANDAVLASMDDEGVFGPVLHRLGFGEAVERGLLTDYKVLVLTVDEGVVSSGFQQELSAHKELTLSDASRLIGCWNGLAKRFAREDGDGLAGLGLSPMRRAVAFAPSIKASKLVEAAYPALVDRLRAGADTHRSLGIEVRHVDGTMNALERGNHLQWLKDGATVAEDADPVCRLLTNARCLSEGVDVPALDAVVFLSPRGSQVDVVQSVGRVMRKDPAGVKQVGYVVLPVVIPAGVRPEDALDDNERFRVVWQVLQALRAHDDRFAAMVNKLDLNRRKDERILVFDTTGRGEGSGTADGATQLALPLDFEKFKDAIYAKIVTKVGERRYWETWASSVAQIAQAHITRITGLLADADSAAAQEFSTFLTGLRGNLNDGITRDDAIEMLAQHLITRPVFDALFGGRDFTTHNPVAQTMERMLATLDEAGLAGENAALDRFYESVQLRLGDIDNSAGRQKILVDLYDNFFAKAFKRRVDKLGIVYTPIEIVDFILRSADDVLREHFGQGLSDEGVHILDGFTGTGTFMTRLLQLGLIEPKDLVRKYRHELHAGEILLLAYYIAAVNIETTYQDLVRETLDPAAGYEPFPGLILTDTFQSWEEGDTLDTTVFVQNNARLELLKSLPIQVIVGNPPYSVGQDSANDNNANDSYPTLDQAIESTYAARSTAASKRSLYDGYIRAIKWATLRIGDRGVVAFVTNGGWLDANSADGMRLALAAECSDIHILNLRGNARTAGEQRKKEGGSVFGGGSRASVAVTILVKDPRHAGQARIHYSDIGDYLSREEKLAAVAAAESLPGLEPRTAIIPNAHGDWLNQRRNDFETFLPIGDKEGGRAVIGLYSLGLATGRDAWVVGSSARAVRASVNSMVKAYNGLLESASVPDRDPRRISWNRNLESDFTRGRRLAFAPEESLRASCYRPFFRQAVYFNRALNAMVYRLNDLFPTPKHQNFGMVAMGPRTEAVPAVLMANSMPDLAYFTYAGQFFARWRYEKVGADEGMLDLGHHGEGEVIDGYRRVDNITDHALATFRAAYGEAITKEDIFFYAYGLLHSPDYRSTYAADLKRMLPRIPLVTDPWPYVEAGRSLSELHLGYENVTPYPLAGLDDPAYPVAGDATAYPFFRVEKMSFAKVRDGATGKLVADRTRVVYNERITLGGIPEAAYRYQLGSRSAIEWIIDRYQVRTDKASGIVNDPNDWSREVSDPRYIIDLLARIVTVSLQTMAIVDELPALEIRSEEHP